MPQIILHQNPANLSEEMVKTFQEIASMMHRLTKEIEDTCPSIEMVVSIMPRKNHAKIKEKA